MIHDTDGRFMVALTEFIALFFLSVALPVGFS